jgi:chemotaxis protein MotA
MDLGSLGGILLALAGILAGLLLEGGHLRQVLQPTAAMIVFGGTLGAVMLQFPLKTVFSAAHRLIRIFLHKNDSAAVLLRQIVGFANKARRHGIVSLDPDLP